MLQQKEIENERLVAGIGDHMAGKSYSGKAGLTSPAYVRWAVAECF